MGSSSHSERPVLTMFKGLQHCSTQALWGSKSSHQTNLFHPRKRKGLTLRFLYIKQIICFWKATDGEVWNLASLPLHLRDFWDPRGCGVPCSCPWDTSIPCERDCGVLVRQPCANMNSLSVSTDAVVSLVELQAWCVCVSLNAPVYASPQQRRTGRVAEELRFCY